MANIIVAGEFYESITGELFEIGRQLRQPNGYPFNAATLRAHLQAAIEGRFNGESFLRNTGELTICIPARKRPTLQQLQAKWPWIKKIERDTSPEGPVVFNLAMVLRDAAEGSINGPEYGGVLLRACPSCSVISSSLGSSSTRTSTPSSWTYSGRSTSTSRVWSVVIELGDRRSVPYGGRSGKRWGAGWGWLRGHFRQIGRLAVSGEWRDLWIWDVWDFNCPCVP